MKLPKTPDTTTKVSLPLPLGIGERAGRECLVLLYGGTIGRKYDLGPGHWTVGRDPYANIVLDADSVSRAHARIEIGAVESWLVDLDSTNGTFVNDASVVRAPLKSGDLVKVGDVIFKFLAGDNIESAYHEEIYRMTIHDGLTGIANKRHFDGFLEREYARSRRHGRELSLLLLDIDHFKKINDSYGHLSGDYVLRELAHLVEERVRRDELFARYGGEEFALVCPETDREGAVQYAEIIRDLISKHSFVFDNTQIAVTVSIGVSSFVSTQERAAELVQMADEALYRAKRGGRNRVSV